MPRPSGGYYNARCVRLPSVTTITGRFGDKSQLMYWAFKQGQKRPQSHDLYEESAKEADVGTLVHAMIEARIKGLKTIETKDLGPDLIAKARQGFSEYQLWQQQSQIEIIQTEPSLVSEEYQYGGTGDGIANSPLGLCAVEWKSSNAIYTDHLIQMAANGHLWNENYPDRPLTGGFHLCRFSKDEGDFAHFHFRDLSAAWRLFVLYREAYDLDKQLKKRLS
jgi:hypothetical protein